VQNLLIEYYDDYEMAARLYSLIAAISFVLDLVSFFAVLGLLASYASDFDSNQLVLSEDYWLT